MGFYEYARKVFEEHYDSQLILSMNKTKTDGPFTKPDWQASTEIIPCRIARKKVVNAMSQGDIAENQYTLTLYASPEVELPPGSRVTVIDAHGVSREYSYSSEGIHHYWTHQEVEIKREVKA